ncbi:MAG: hypothetical protein KAQ83_03635 [Nanoarchaeota archaeon]|nr:hypothetical protein [Nanoarchaeota archaeon]
MENSNYTLLDHLQVESRDISAIAVYRGGFECAKNHETIYSTDINLKNGTIAVILLAQEESGLERRVITHTSNNEDDVRRPLPILEKHLMAACDYVEDMPVLPADFDEENNIFEIETNPLIKSYAVIVGCDENRMNEAREYLSNHLDNVQIQEIIVPKSYGAFSVSLYDKENTPIVTIAEGNQRENGEIKPSVIISKPIISRESA